jgi:hypothetical protein
MGLVHSEHTLIKPSKPAGFRPALPPWPVRVEITAFRTAAAARKSPAPQRAGRAKWCCYHRKQWSRAQRWPAGRQKKPGRAGGCGPGERLYLFAATYTGKPAPLPSYNVAGGKRVPVVARKNLSTRVRVWSERCLVAASNERDRRRSSVSGEGPGRQKSPARDG